MNENDLELYCLLGKPFQFENVGYVHMVTIDEMLFKDSKKYNESLSLFLLSDEEICSKLNLTDNKKITAFEFLWYQSCMDSKFAKNITDAFKFFFKKDFFVSEEECFFLGEKEENKKIHKMNYPHFVDILRTQNCMKKAEVKTPKSNSEKVREYYEKLRKAKSKHDEKFNKVQIDNIISAVCAKHPSINLLNVGELTLYQLIDQYKRLHMIDEYSINIDSLLHGASSEDIKLIHWSSAHINNE